MSRPLRERVLERDGYRCVRCGKTERLVLDHIEPRSIGGSNGIRNRQTLCYECDRDKADAKPPGWSPYQPYRQSP